MKAETGITEGIYLVTPYGEYFQKGEIDAFVKSFRIGKEGQTFFLCSGKYVYGIIKLNIIKSITIKEFNTTKPKHKISSFLREIWWGLREPLYYHEFTTIKVFKSPRQYNNSTGVRSVIKNIELNKDVG